MVWYNFKKEGENGIIGFSFWVIFYVLLLFYSLLRLIWFFIIFVGKYGKCRYLYFIDGN